MDTLKHHNDITIIPVLDKPVVLLPISTVTYCQHAMVKLSLRAPTLVVDTNVVLVNQN